MISQKIQKALQGSSAIRAMFVEGNELAARVGRENVYDFSLGNPATPAPAALNEAIKQLVDETDPLVLHGYMDNAGYPDVRQAVAENLNRRFGTAFTSHNIVMTVGAAGGLNIIFKTILDPGDEVIVFAPYFGEYKSMRPILMRKSWKWHRILKHSSRIWLLWKKRSMKRPRQ